MIGLAKGKHRDTAIEQRPTTDDRFVPLTVEHDVFVHFVAEYEAVAASDAPGQFVQVTRCQHRAGRVVW